MQCNITLQVRVPTDNVKQRLQAGIHATTSDAIAAILRGRGGTAGGKKGAKSGLRGFYVGCWWCECSCDVHFCFLHSAHVTLTINLQLHTHTTDGSTLAREVPFAAVQFPLYERAKAALRAFNRARRLEVEEEEARQLGSVQHTQHGDNNNHNNNNNNDEDGVVVGDDDLPAWQAALCGSASGAFAAASW
jgi:hypothetical protein